MKKKLSFFLVIIFIINTLALNPDTSFAAEYPAAPEVSGSSAILMEADTGAVLYEKNSHKKAVSCQYYKGYDGTAYYRKL